MATNTTRADDSSVSEQTANNLPAKIGFVVGIDGDGDVHVHYPAAGVVKVHSIPEDYEVGDRFDNDPERVEPLNGHPLAQWMRYVSSERGEWQTTTHRAPDEFDGGEVQ